MIYLLDAAALLNSESFHFSPKGTYYTTSNQNIWSPTPARYLRYKLFLDTTDSKSTPSVSDISFTFPSSCTPPGQVYFSALPNGNNYKISLSKDGYNDQDVSVDMSSSHVG